MKKNNQMEIKLLTITSIQLLIIVLNFITLIETINTPFKLNQQYYYQQDEHFKKAQLQRHSKQQQQQLNIEPEAQQLVDQQHEEQQFYLNGQSTTESIENLIEQQQLRERQIVLIQERQRQQQEQLQQLGVHLVCDTHLCSSSTGVFGGFGGGNGGGGGRNGGSSESSEDYVDTKNDLNNNVNVNAPNQRFRSALTGSSSSETSLALEVKQCSCNQSCTKYGDCCLDSVSSKVSLDKKFHGGFKSDSPWRHWQCTTLRILTHSIHILTIGGCSRFWPRKPGDSIQEKCEEVGSGLVDEDPFLSVPIYSLRTKQNYRNLYCAVCNYDAAYASTWETFTMCVKNDSQGRCSKSFVYFEKPQGVDLHECYPSDYDSCPNSLSIMSEEVIKCGLYYAPVKLATGLTAKNEWCASCNNVTIVGSVCPETRPTYERPPINLHGSGRHFSLPVILDIDFTTGGLIVGTQERCPPNNVYDPWKRACRVVTCDRDSQLEGDQCVPNSDVHTDGTSLTFHVCPKISFNPEEYVIYSNGTVYITSRDKQIEPGHYRIDISTQKLSICAHSHVILIGKFSSTHDYLSNIGTSISIISLCIKIVLFFCVPQPRRTANIVILFLCISLLLAQSLFLFGITLTSNPLFCSIIGIGIHYLYLASFFWMNVLSYDIFCTFSMDLRLVPQGKISSSRQIICYSFYGMFTPLLVILASTLTDQFARSSIFAPNYGHEICWVSNRLALLVFFAMPVAILLIINAGIFFAFTATRINKISKIGKLARENVAIRRKTFIIYTKLFLIMGLTWIFGFIAAYAKNSFLWSLFIVFNSLQGFYILIAFTDIKWGNLRNLINCPLHRKTTSSSSIATATTISTEQ
ncbi:uncharacterized protein LOC128389960 [Panonychus citri]|uniref:uncharacterized protein LOC128389960 n=1 Tax=Panonychus citri TaxID=50023 RepID=UPI0023073969|nr:uncharacterized protein LOC128389960 [Panonychus citri]